MNVFLKLTYRNLCVEIISFRHEDSLVSEWDGLTSHATIFQLYTWLHIDVKADWRIKLNLRSGSHAIYISYGS